MKALARLALVATLVLIGCPIAELPPDAGTVDAGPIDSGGLDAGVDPYLYTAPPAAFDAGLEPALWQTHLQDDLLPYWRMTEAHGAPVGNFPTYRGMNGVASPTRTDRRPRMLGRQIYAYSMAYMLTGDESLLALARAGNRWLIEHARDRARGSWHALLDSTGAPKGEGAKLSQDMSYVAMGPAAYFFVTADADAEAAVLETRDMLFDPATYWDSANGRIKDGLDAAQTAEAYMGAQGSWELVAQLDPMSSFLMLVQPVLTEPARRTQVLGDLRTLGTLLRSSFWQDGFFWGATGTKGQYGSNHSDFGHMLKTHWMLLQLDKRLPEHPFADFVREHTAATLTMAYDKSYGRWAKQPSGADSVRYGSDWWAYAECDQLAATLAMHDASWLPTLATTSKHFREDYVDRTRPAREVVPSIARDGYWVSSWPDSDTAKCNEWKSGFHSVEHALVMTLLGHWATGTPAPLYFAFPAAQVQELAARARPYTFLGRVAQVEDLGPLASDATRHKVRIHFDQLR